MKIPFKHSKRGSCVFIDLGSRYVKAISVAEDGAQFKIQNKIKVKRKDLSQDSIENVLSKIVNHEKKSGRETKNVFIVSTAPVFYNLPYEISYSVSERRFLPLIDEVAQLFYKKNRKFVEGIKRENDGEKFVSPFLSGSFIDGSLSDSPFESEGKSFNFKFVYTVAPKNFIEDTERAFESSRLRLKRVLPPHPFYVREIINTTQQDDQSLNCILIDVGAAVTAISLIKKGAFLKEGYVSLGADLFTKKIMRDFNLPFYQAQNLKHLFSKKMLGKKGEAKVRESLEKPLFDFSKVINATLKSGFDLEGENYRVHLVGGGAKTLDLKDALGHEFLSLGIKGYFQNLGSFEKDFFPVIATASSFLRQEWNEEIERIIRRSLTLSS